MQTSMMKLIHRQRLPTANKDKEITKDNKGLSGNAVF